MSRTNDFIETFEYIQGVLICNPGYSLKEKYRESIELFLSDNESIVIWDYLMLNFCFYTKTRSRLNALPVKMFLCKNAIKRWKEKDSKYMFFVSKFITDRNLLNPITDVFENSRWSEEYLKNQRTKWFNQPQGYVNCISFEGMLYDEKECLNCKYKALCIKSL